MLVLFIGDMHCGSRDGIADEDSGQLTARNRPLLRAWLEMERAASKEKSLILMLGGDLVDGVQHHGAITWGNRKEQRECAIRLITPLADRATRIFSLLGTEAHAAQDGEEDETGGEALGAEAGGHQHLLEIGGQLIDWAHHGINVSIDPRNEDNGLIMTAKRVEELALRNGARVPDLVVSHHAHRAPMPVTVRGITVAVCPCWQLSTGFGYMLSPRTPPSIGSLAYWPKRRTLKRWLYPMRREIRHVKD